MNGFAVCVIDKSVEEDPNALVAPHSQELVNFVEAIRSRHRQAVVDARQVTQVEDVVKFGRRRRQLTHCSSDTHRQTLTFNLPSAITTKRSLGSVSPTFIPLPSTRQHPSYGDCLEVKREYYQNCSVLDCVTQNVYSQQHTYVSSSFRFNRLCLSHWDPYAVRRGSCLELYYCNMAEWFWWDSSLILTTNWFPSVL